MRARHLIILELLCLAWGTFMLCNPAVKSNLQVFEWMLSLVSSLALALTSLQATKRTKSPASAAMMASVLIFATVFLTCMATAVLGLWVEK